MVSPKELTDITNMGDRIIEALSRSQLDPAVVMGAFHDILESKSAETNWRPPVWWRTAEHQIARARRLWPKAVLPKPPKEFTPQTKSEVLLLHVPDSLDLLWGMVVAPKGHIKFRREGLKADKMQLRLAPNKTEFSAPVWLAFDPEHGSGESPDSLWGQPDLAGSEVLSALIQFPEWPRTWVNGALAPNLSGYQLLHREEWSRVLCLERVDNRQLELRHRWADHRGNASSPSVKEVLS